MNPLVTVIVTHHLDENYEYLNLCLKSILASQGVIFELFCVADTQEHPRIDLLDERLNLYWKRELNTASAKINWAIQRASGKYFWIISDDVMVSPHAMKTMVEGMADNSIICNPMSNSDNGSQFWADLRIPVKLSKEELNPAWLDRERIPPFLIPVRQFVAFYCTMIPRKVWEAVGELDPQMDFRHNDEDYCIRASRLGIPSMINLGAFALHFGDKTLPKCTTKEQLEECTRVFLEKYRQA